ncbi:AAA family ATPase [Nostoc sp. PCC 7107]|uniref:AAA family ATPase n=1 Tax=Nostoc sp. PCC 7107 TaxID=317936 RepID=UPI00029EF865|nr:AAA family ATPase [Nostoc sp. PCC 7107]AFY42144.1 AAA ATPase [Nostoc sp. PCC 7107]
MRIKQISVNGLFGIFDHVIPLNMDERITIIHGPNGFGKTAILRILNSFLKSRDSELLTIPYKNFRIEFDDDIIIDIIPNNVDNAEDFPGEFKRYNILFNLDKNSKMVDLQQKPESLEELKKNINIRLIESQRLLNSVPKRSRRQSAETHSMVSTVSAYSDELARLMQRKFREYATISESLDRTFPIRIVKHKPSADVSNEQLRHKFSELEATRSRLVAVGLLDKDENSEVQIQPQDIDESTKNALLVYVEDMEKKLSVFAEIASKIELLKKIINNKFAYSYKEINFSKEKGFIFTTFYNSSLSNSKTLSAMDLSSGEQHELVLLYELLFKVQPKSLVLIDEPELSLHVGWQVQFLKDLREITQLADLDILMATHSPDIIQDRWDLTVELKGLEK